MKYAKRLVAVTAVVGSLLVGGVPAQALTTTSAPFTGDLIVGTGLSSSTGLGIYAPCANGSAGTEPSVGAGTCSLALWGGISGDCLSWAGNVSGWLRTTIGAARDYDLNLWVTNTGGVLTLSGSATDTATGASKLVSGEAVFTERNGVTTNCTRNDGGVIYTAVGELAITG